MLHFLSRLSAISSHDQTNAKSTKDPRGTASIPNYPPMKWTVHLSKDHFPDQEGARGMDEPNKSILLLQHDDRYCLAVLIWPYRQGSLASQSRAQCPFCYFWRDRRAVDFSSLFCAEKTMAMARTRQPRGFHSRMLCGPMPLRKGETP